MDTCELRDFAREHKWQPCCQNMTREHILAKQLFVKNPEGLRLAYEVYGDYFYADTCWTHNAGNKCADTTAAVLYLMRKRLREHPEVFPVIIEEVAATFTVVPEYLRMEYLRG